MAVFSVTALDRLIDADRKSSSSTRTEPPPKQQNSFVRQRRPLYVSYPYSPTTPASPPPPSRTRSASPTSFSPSPYVVNHKRRVPNGVDSKRTTQQNGFHVSEKGSASQPAESQELLSKSGKEKIDSQNLFSHKNVSDKHEEKTSVVIDHNRSPRSSLALELDTKTVNDGINGNDSPLLRKAISDGNYLRGYVDASEQKSKWEEIEVADKAEMSSKSDDPRGKKKLEDSSYEGSTSRDGNPSRSIKILDSARDYSRTTSSSSSEEWFDAPDGLPPEYFSEDESRRYALADSSPTFKGGSDSNVFMQLKLEVQKRIAAEEAKEALRRQRDGMAQMLSWAGISVPQSDSGDFKFADIDKVSGVSDILSQRISVTRYVAGAVATGAVRAEAEAELQTVLAEKSREIARLKDKLQYYEVVNHEMSQRNQESIENARQSRRRRQRRQRLAFLGLGAAICVGVSVTAIYFYVPWEHVKNLRNGSVLPEGELPTPPSLEQAGDLRGKLWVWQVLMDKSRAILRRIKGEDPLENRPDGDVPNPVKQGDCTCYPASSCCCCSEA